MLLGEFTAQATLGSSGGPPDTASSTSPPLAVRQPGRRRTNQPRWLWWCSSPPLSPRRRRIGWHMRRLSLGKNKLNSFNIEKKVKHSLRPSHRSLYILWSSRERVRLCDLGNEWVSGERHCDWSVTASPDWLAPLKLTPLQILREGVSFGERVDLGKECVLEERVMNWGERVSCGGTVWYGPPYKWDEANNNM